MSDLIILCLQALEMKRIDALHGVLSLTCILFITYFFYLIGYLDDQTYHSVIHSNSFYKESIADIPILDYISFKILIYAISIYFSTTLCVLMCGFNVRRVSRFQIQCYRPYYLYHGLVCLIPLILKYANIANIIADDIMIQLEWKSFYSVKTSVLRFIYSFFSSVVRKYECWRLILYLIIAVICAFVYTYIFSSLCINCGKLLDHENIKGEFLTTWSHFDHYHEIRKINVSQENCYKTTYLLNISLFLQTGQKMYHTASMSKKRLVDGDGKAFPYEKGALEIAYGESVRLSCSAARKTNDKVIPIWLVNGSYLDLNMDIYSLENNVRNKSISSHLSIDFIENSAFGDYSCHFQIDEYYGKKVSFENKSAVLFKDSSEIIIAQYHVQQYNGKNIYVYAAPGGVIDLSWKIMNFNNEKEDVIQYYYVNGNHLQEQDTNSLTSLVYSTLSYLYIAVGNVMEWFAIPYSSTSSSGYLIKYDNFYMTRLVKYSGPSVFGVHTVEYFRRVYDNRSKTFVLREVKHPDTLYVLPDLPYFYKMDNATKEKKKLMIEYLQELNLVFSWFENSHYFVLMARVVFEIIILLLGSLLIFLVVTKSLKVYKCAVLCPLKRKVLEQPLCANQCSVRGGMYLYTCYILCGEIDKQSVYRSLVCPLRKANISVGFNCEECVLNKCGKSIFDIQCDLLRHCEHLIFFITSSYLKESSFDGINLENLLSCTKSNTFSSNRVLFIIADKCKLPYKVYYLCPEASILDWIVCTDSEERCRLILDWIKKKKENKTSELVVSFPFAGQSCT